MKINYEKILISFSVSLLIISYYPFKYFNYPFHTELYTVYIINLLVGIVFFSLSIYLYLIFFFNRSSLLFNFIRKSFFFFIFVFFVKSLVLLFGFKSFISFFLVFDLDIHTKLQKILLLLFLFIIFYISSHITKYYRFDFLKFINLFSSILLIIIIVNSVGNKKFFFKQNILDQNIKFIKTDKVPDRRVIFLIFDELDQKILNENIRNLKNFSNLKENSINFENAYAPGRDTMNSISALLIGHDGTGKIGHETNKYFFYGNNFKKYIDYQSSIFSNTQKDNATLIGSQVISYCIYININNCSDSTKDIGDENLNKYFTTIYFFFNLLSFPFKEETISSEEIKIDKTKSTILKKKYDKILNNEQKKYDRIIKNTFSAIENVEQEIVFVHFPFPHPPSIYAQKFYDKNNNNLDYSYLANLKFSDYILGKILEKLKINSISQEILLIVSSDHGVRSEIKYRAQQARKVPLIINIKNSTYSYTINKKISSFHTKKLIEKFLKKEINDSHEIIKLFNNSKFVPTTNLNEDILYNRRLKKKNNYFWFKK